ncbi:Hypothetical predicted protein [Olea europaea subsp. europaea]|uniref:Uncharacterized protein n=1 Tax=Olea europaea subsp. europaea TaxID=158383 RepID=A0A8S0PYN1_OLEEU|nr:Hypothetical predicted protein [Olea europaea subsp. europaea]
MMLLSLSVKPSPINDGHKYCQPEEQIHPYCATLHQRFGGVRSVGVDLNSLARRKVNLRSEVSDAALARPCEVIDKISLCFGGGDGVYGGGVVVVVVRCFGVVE